MFGKYKCPSSSATYITISDILKRHLAGWPRNATHNAKKASQPLHNGTGPFTKSSISGQNMTVDESNPRDMVLRYGMKKQTHKQPAKNSQPRVLIRPAIPEPSEVPRSKERSPSLCRSTLRLASDENLNPEMNQVTLSDVCHSQNDSPISP